MKSTGTSGVRQADRRSHLLVVEDEPKVARALQEGLQDEGYDVALASTGEEGFFLASSREFDLVVLDVMLPGRSGFEILSALRSRGFGIPILMLTARAAVEDRVRGLDHGADDYLVKPFAFSELAARIRVLLRRGRLEPATHLSVADLHLDLLTRHASRGATEIELTHREFELLEYLVRYRGHLVSREMLARDVWRETSRGTPLDNVIDVHIARLRKKVDQNAAVKLIQTIRGVGYIIKAEGP